MEVASQAYLALDLKYLSETDADSLFEDLELAASKIAALNRSLNVSVSKVKLK